MLKGVVQFADGDEDGETQALVKINFKNGKTLRFKEGFHEEYFVAYFPDEDILLCERGHSSDLSFNLKNGEETELTGNPNHIKTSADGKLRVNSYFDGQEYFGYFLQKKVGNRFVKFIDFNAEFEKHTRTVPFFFTKIFWTKSGNLLLKMDGSGDGENMVPHFFEINFK